MAISEEYVLYVWACIHKRTFELVSTNHTLANKQSRVLAQHVACGLEGGSGCSACLHCVLMTPKNNDDDDGDDDDGGDDDDDEASI